MAIWKAALGRKRGIKNLKRKKIHTARLARRAYIALQAKLVEESKEVAQEVS